MITNDHPEEKFSMRSDHYPLAAIKFLHKTQGIKLFMLLNVVLYFTTDKLVTFILLNSEKKVKESRTRRERLNHNTKTAWQKKASHCFAPCEV